jgi:hypothetical protein
VYTLATVKPLTIGRRDRMIKLTTVQFAIILALSIKPYLVIALLVVGDTVVYRLVKLSRRF